MHSNSRSQNQFLIALLCVFLLAPGEPWAYARPLPSAAPSQDQEAPRIPDDQLDSLVAPIALYPDPLLAQVLAASTYPLELVQLQQWLGKHPDLKDQALTDAVQKEDWDPSVQSMAVFPDVVKQLVDGIKWTTDLGNAFLAQQSDVMDAVQRMRKKAMDAGNLKTTEQQQVETKVVETKTIVVIQQADPQIVYVPSYNPVIVYGPPVYPYPAIYYPPPSYYAAGVAIAFGVGFAVGAYYHGGWGYRCGWGYGHSTVNINVNNNYIKHYNNTNINRGNINNGNINRGNGNRASTLPANGGNWQHNPQHRGGTPYSDRSTANRYGGTARGDSAATRQANARQNVGQRPSGGAGQAGANRPGGGGPGNAGANRPGGGAGNAGANRPGGGGAGNAGANRPAGGGGGQAGANRPSGGDRVGDRQVPKTPSGNNKGAFGGASSGQSGGAAKSSSQRGASSMGASRGGGAPKGGGGRKK